MKVEEYAVQLEGKAFNDQDIINLAKKNGIAIDRKRAASIKNSIAKNLRYTTERDYTVRPYRVHLISVEPFIKKRSCIERLEDLKNYLDKNGLDKPLREIAKMFDLDHSTVFRHSRNYI